MKTDVRPFGETEEVASATECTGLMPSLPADEEADAACASLYAIHDAKDARKEQYRKK